MPTRRVSATRTALPHVDRALIEAVRDALAARADAERATSMQAYMKSAMPYYGVPAPGVKAVSREVFAAHRLPDAEAWRDTVLALFREATYREEWYVAIALAEARPYRSHARERAALALYDEIVLRGAWWDVVDTVASHLLGGLHEAHPAWAAKQMRVWAVAGDEEHADSLEAPAGMWKRRAAILSQLSRKDATDLALLYDCIEPNLASREFFIAKAIGWALRQVAWRDPDEVIRYVESHREQLSALSKREALKNVLKSGRIASIP